MHVQCRNKGYALAIRSISLVQSDMFMGVCRRWDCKTVKEAAQVRAEADGSVVSIL